MEHDDDETCDCPSCTLPVYEEGVCGRVVPVVPEKHLPRMPQTAEEWQQALKAAREARRLAG